MGGPYCVAYGCLNSFSKTPQLSFFKLPTDLERRSQWLHLISREDLMNKKPKNYTVCEEHFNVGDILKETNRKKLKNNSLPSLRLPDLQKKDEKTRQLVEISTQTEDNLHTVYGVRFEAHIIKTENEVHHEEEETTEPNIQHCLVPVKRERDDIYDVADVLPETAKKQKRDGSSAGAEDLLVTLRDRLINDNSIIEVSTETAKDLVELLQELTQGDSFDAFGRYVALALRRMPARTAQDMQPKIVELLVGGAAGAAETTTERKPVSTFDISLV